MIKLIQTLIEKITNYRKLWFGLIFIGSVSNALINKLNFFHEIPYITLCCFLIGFVIGLIVHIRGKWLWL